MTFYHLNSAIDEDCPEFAEAELERLLPLMRGGVFPLLHWKGWTVQTASASTECWQGTILHESERVADFGVVKTKEAAAAMTKRMTVDYVAYLACNSHEPQLEQAFPTQAPWCAMLDQSPNADDVRVKRLVCSLGRLFMHPQQ